jgi:hypothetical protein
MNNEEVETRLDLDLAQFVKKFPVNQFYVGFDYLYIEENSDVETMTSFKVFMKNRLKSYRAVTFGLGAKLISADVKNKSISAIPFGISAKFLLPIRSLPISLKADLYYSPKPLTFSDGDTYFEQRYELNIEVIDKGEIFIGYRDINSDLQNSVANLEISKIPYAGLRFGF